MMNRLDKSVERMKKTSGRKKTAEYGNFWYNENRKMKIQDWRKEKKS